jgi:hypothetical protein
VSTNFVGASDLGPDYDWTTNEITEGFSMEKESKDIRTLENLVASTQKKIDSAKKKKKEKGGVATRSKPHQEKEPEKSEGHTSVAPQYKYVTPQYFTLPHTLRRTPVVVTF